MVLPGYWYYPARAKNIQNFGASSTKIVILLFRRYGRRNFRPIFFSAENFSAEIFFGRLFFSVGGLGGRSRYNHFKKFAPGGQIFGNGVVGGSGGALPPSGISVTRALPPGGGSGGLRPLRNLRYPCLAPAARRTDGEKSKNELQGSYRPRNLTI